MNFLLKRVRLSWYFIFFFLVYIALAFLLPKQKFDSAALTLFSVNSFLYGFYIAPILGAQKARIEELHKTVRSEANAIFSMALKLKKMPPELRNDLQKEIKEYISISSRQQKIAQGEKEYEDLIGFCVEYKGKNEEEVNKLLDALIENQKNRTQFSMLMSNKVYNNEWIIILMLFSITLGFVVLIDVGSSVVLAVIKAPPGNVSLDTMLVEISKLEAIRAIGLPGDLFADFEGLQRQMEQLFGASGWPSSSRAARVVTVLLPLLPVTATTGARAASANNSMSPITARRPSLSKTRPPIEAVLRVS